MTGGYLHSARGELGRLWGLERPLRASELGRICRLRGRDPGKTILDMERGDVAISGPVSAIVDMLLAGAKPADEGWRSA